MIAVHMKSGGHGLHCTEGLFTVWGLVFLMDGMDVGTAASGRSWVLSCDVRAARRRGGLFTVSTGGSLGLERRAAASVVRTYV